MRCTAGRGAVHWVVLRTVTVTAFRSIAASGVLTLGPVSVIIGCNYEWVCTTPWRESLMAFHTLGIAA